MGRLWKPWSGSRLGTREGLGSLGLYRKGSCIPYDCIYTGAVTAASENRNSLVGLHIPVLICLCFSSSWTVKNAQSLPLTGHFADPRGRIALPRYSCLAPELDRAR